MQSLLASTAFALDIPNVVELVSARLAPHAAEPLSEVALVVKVKYLFTVVAIETWLIDQLNVLPFRALVIMN
jgi:hypothetical protein